MNPSYVSWALLTISLLPSVLCHGIDSCANPFTSNPLIALNKGSIPYLRSPSIQTSTAFCHSPSSQYSCCDDDSYNAMKTVIASIKQNMTESIHLLPSHLLTVFAELFNVNLTGFAYNEAQKNIIKELQTTLTPIILSGKASTCIDGFIAHIQGTLCWSCDPNWHENFVDDQFLLHPESCASISNGCSSFLSQIASITPTILNIFTRLAISFSTSHSQELKNNLYWILISGIGFSNQVVTAEAICTSPLTAYLLNNEVVFDSCLSMICSPPVLRGLDYTFESLFLYDSLFSMRVNGIVQKQYGSIYHLMPEQSNHGHRRLLSVNPQLHKLKHVVSLMHGSSVHDSHNQIEDQTPINSDLSSLIPSVSGKNITAMNGRVVYKLDGMGIDTVAIGCSTSLTHVDCPSRILTIGLNKASLLSFILVIMSILSISFSCLVVRRLYTIQHMKQGKLFEPLNVNVDNLEIRT